MKKGKNMSVWRLGRFRFLILTVMGLAAAVLWLVSRQMVSGRLFLQIEIGGVEQGINGWQDENGDSLCFFLPSGARSVRWGVDGARAFLEDGTRLEDGAPCDPAQGSFSITQRSLFGLVQKTYQIRILQSSRTASAWLDTGSRKMDYVLRKKGNEETGTLRLADEKGKAAYAGAVSSVRGRGNYTWLLEKKSFSLTLGEAADLLSMGPDSEWVLLASASEDTHLITPMVFEMMRSAGIARVPEWRWVDLYLNGEYAGNYLLSERIAMPAESMEQSGAFLIEFDGYWQEEGKAGFQTQAGDLVAIRYPDAPSAQEQAAIRGFVQRAENAVMSADGKDAESGLSWQELIDSDSLVKKYVLDEISKCPDGWNGSNYCYLKDGKLYFGAPWDYEFSFGNQPAWFSWLKLPDGLFHKEDTSWYRGLYEKETFREAAARVYETVFRPFLLEQAGEGLDRAAEKIADSMAMDAYRWGREADLSAEKTEELKEYIQDRLAWLDGEWLEMARTRETPYYALRLMDGDEEYAVYYIREGSVIRQEMLERTEDSFTGWFEDTSAAVLADVAGKPVYRDVTLYAGWDRKAERADLAAGLLPLVCFLLILSVWLCRTMFASVFASVREKR